MRFEKWQALGNDYLIVERDELPFELTPARVSRLCEGHFGVFADGVLLLLAPAERPSDVADLRIFNPDGSEAELSGNGAREAIMYLRRRGWTEQDEFSIHTAAGKIRPTITGPDTCRVDMGQASLTRRTSPAGRPTGAGSCRSAARHAGALPARVDRQPAVRDPRRPTEAALDALDLPAIGPPIEGTSSFPNRTNVSWYTELDGPDPAAPSRRGSGRGSSSAGWGRRCPRARARRAPRSPISRGAAAAAAGRVTVVCCSTAASSRSRSGRICA